MNVSSMFSTLCIEKIKHHIFYMVKFQVLCCIVLYHFGVPPTVVVCPMAQILARLGNNFFSEISPYFWKKVRIFSFFLKILWNLKHTINACI